MTHKEYTREKPGMAQRTSTGWPIVRTRKTRRNEKCPCGSNKKFKVCCADPY